MEGADANQSGQTNLTVERPTEETENTNGDVIRNAWHRRLCDMLLRKSTHPFDAVAMLVSNQMSQMLLLLPSCVARLGWLEATIATVIFGLLSCWTAHLTQAIYFQRITSVDLLETEGLDQWDKLFSRRADRSRKWIKLGKLGMVLNCLYHFTRLIIQLSYAGSIMYFLIDKFDKRAWTYALACCCIPFALLPTLRNYRIVSMLSLVMATVAAVSIIAVASLHHKPDHQKVKRSMASGSIWSLAWVSSTIVYAFGDGSISVETLVTIKEPENQKKFKYVFWGSTAFATALSLAGALIPYWVFGDALSKIPLAAQPSGRPGVLEVLPPYLRDVASVSLLILELVTIGHSLCPLFMYLKRGLHQLTGEQQGKCRFWHRMAVVGLVSILAAAVPFAGSMEITSLVGSLIVSPAVYIVPAATHMLWFQSSQSREGDYLQGFALKMTFLIDAIQFVGVLIFVAIMGGLLTSIKEVAHSDMLRHSDFRKNCYLCLSLSKFLDLHPAVFLVILTILSIGSIPRSESSPLVVAKIIVAKMILVVSILIIVLFIINLCATMGRQLTKHL